MDGTSPLGCWENDWDKEMGWRCLDVTHKGAYILAPTVKMDRELCPGSCLLTTLPRLSGAKAPAPITPQHGLVLDLGQRDPRGKHPGRQPIQQKAVQPPQCHDSERVSLHTPYHSLPLSSEMDTSGKRMQPWAASEQSCGCQQRQCLPCEHMGLGHVSAPFMGKGTRFNLTFRASTPKTGDMSDLSMRAC